MPLNGFASFDISNIVVASALLLLLAGVPGLFCAVRAGQRLAALLTVAAAAAGIPAAVMAAFQPPVAWQLSWGLPFGPARLALDPLSCFFLLPVFLVAGCGALFALKYRPARSGRDRFLTLLYALMPGSMAFILLSRDAVSFLLAWEGMALSAAFLMLADHEEPPVREAGILYLIATHTSTLVLVAFFGMLFHLSGSFVFPATGSLPATPALATLLFLASLAGFGAKAGLMPLHVWLPSAHANAPSHVSALMSGVVLKMGVYGIVRTVSLFDAPPLWWGGLLLALGTLSAVGGVAFALGQHDLKRLLAYHSIENIGIIAMGLGIGLAGMSLGNSAVALLGLAGGLLHVLNHATFKSLLFFGAGAVIHATGSRELDRAGGLIRVMPRTAACFMVGAAAICGLPPLNGFVSELLVYLGLLRQAVGGSGWLTVLAVAAIPALALVGGLAVACFVKVVGVVFLGEARQPRPAAPHEPPWQMLAPMGVLAVLCGGIGLLPLAMAPLLEAVAGGFTGLEVAPGALADQAPLLRLSLLAAVLLGLCGLLALAYRFRLQSAPRGSSGTWGCGYPAPSPRMQYSASSFAASLVEILSPLLRPHAHRPEIAGPAPKPSRFASHVPEVVLDLVVLPFLHRAEAWSAPLRRLQHGHLHLYMLYIFAVLCALLLWVL
ncbi:proton-conducting transporter transmembrane domain-containing protein [Trichlorobacter ammonificans]|uniref:Ech-hydrogenase-related complex, NuoL-like integral membrane lipoprotein subunit n=1 Tax=Trichlorobacter ammonificans TaxID=2916410 RepID=A0ABM9D5D9_9BACT|nr:proton-conducting transporter membrane subunit [Trichlorobacter ammonificans]CAH2030448.1 Ech-hydrogenase-related complex, NuoL-like integral membrane lipoprotein subunit [Trichlorobacter ammonificans]